MTDPNAFYGISTVLEQEYLLLNELQEPKKQHLRVLFQEYLLKASGFLEADLLEEFSFSERLERIAGLYTEDFHSIRKALLEEMVARDWRKIYSHASGTLFSSNNPIFVTYPSKFMRFKKRLGGDHL